MLLRRANVHMLAGQAGTFKTMVALNMVANMGVDTVYMSNDSDDTTVMSRLLGMATARPTTETEEWLDEASGRVEYASRMLARYSHVKWDFANSPSLDDIWHQLYAHVELHGVYPELLVVDIAMNVAHNEGDEWATLRAIMREMQSLARETEAAVLVVHHASEGATTKPCPARRDIMGKGSIREALMVTIGTNDVGELYAAAVKNRFGRANRDAKDHFQMGIDPATSRVYDWHPGMRQVHTGIGAGLAPGEEKWW